MSPPARPGAAVHPDLSRRERHLRIAALLVLLGLAIEAASFLRVHPLAFLLFLCIGGLAILAGTGMYLLSLLEAERMPSRPPG